MHIPVHQTCCQELRASTVASQNLGTDYIDRDGRLYKRNCVDISMTK